MKKRQKQNRQNDTSGNRRASNGGNTRGGLGEPDYTRGSAKAEVKNWQRPVDSGVVRKAKEKGVKEIVSISGFTSPAIEEAKKAGITLIDRGKRLT